MSRKPKEPVEETSVPPPRANPDLFGQEKAEAMLLRAARSGRLPHGWLITGPRGVGKATLAYRFARFLLKGGAEADDAGPSLFGEAAPATPSLALGADHPIFRQVAQGAHPDLLVLERSLNEKTGKMRSEVRVEESRDAVGFLHHTASAGGWRVIIADSIDEMNRNAANSLLKALEEPPDRAVLLLVSHAPGGLLPTIRSRCCHLPLSLLSDETVERLLTRHHPDLDAASRSLLVQLAEGSIGRAEELLAAGGIELYRALIQLLATLPRLSIEKAHGFADLLARGDGTAFRTAGELLSWWLSRALRHGAEGREPTPLLAEEKGLSARLLARRRLADWVGLWEKLSRLFARAERANLDRKQVMLAALLDMESLAAG